MERPTGFEPATSSLGSWHSATELRPPSAPYITPHGEPSAALTSGSEPAHRTVGLRGRTMRAAAAGQPSTQRLLDRHLRRLDPLVAARLPRDALAGAVQIELLVERCGRRILDPE